MSVSRNTHTGVKGGDVTLCADSPIQEKHEGLTRQKHNRAYTQQSIVQLMDQMDDVWESTLFLYQTTGDYVSIYQSSVGIYYDLGANNLYSSY